MKDESRTLSMIVSVLVIGFLFADLFLAGKDVQVVIAAIFTCAGIVAYIISTVVYKIGYWIYKKFFWYYD